MLTKRFVTKNNDNLIEVAQYLLDHLTKSKVILLDGELGAGKTTLLKHLAKLININEPITSSTFNYMKTYKGLVHIDAYNLKGSIEEFEDYQGESDILAIEWASKLDLYFDNYISVKAYIDGECNHIFDIEVIK
ncbi:tRNA (adenosine(37)-N6)-threonylcarbamoyltransferase complex ATPase subunit type 1 TsaE [Mycoplasmopsis adleri]|uniref:tRNA (adenosine(37)-N6)-threonylcarbamoyltransferase complex ATPase subunit type 1 TsaE n=1 Tax=Mycoplasmopsis adleri TaxID=51362 RepID=UPI0038734BAD